MSITTLEIINPKDLNIIPRGEPYIRIHKRGMFFISYAAVKLMNLKAGDCIGFGLDSKVEKEQDKRVRKYILYIYKDLTNTKFKVGDLKPRSNNFPLRFYCKSLTRELKQKLDLPLQDGRLKSVKLDIEENPVNYNDLRLFKVS